MQLCLVNSLAKHENLQKAKSCFCKIQIMNLVWIMKFNWYKRKGRGLSLCFNTTLMFVTSSHVSDWPLPVHNVSNKKKNYEVTPLYGWACNSTHIPAAQKFSLLTVRNSIFVYLVSRVLPCLHLAYVKNFRYYQLVDQGPNSAEPRGPANTISKMFKLCLKTLVPKKTTNVCVAEMRLRLLF